MRKEELEELKNRCSVASSENRRQSTDSKETSVCLQVDFGGRRLGSRGTGRCMIL